jgi:hypothetical protein
VISMPPGEKIVSAPTQSQKKMDPKLQRMGERAKNMENAKGGPCDGCSGSCAGCALASTSLRLNLNALEDLDSVLGEKTKEAEEKNEMEDQSGPNQSHHMNEIGMTPKFPTREHMQERKERVREQKDKQDISELKDLFNLESGINTEEITVASQPVGLFRINENTLTRPYLVDDDRQTEQDYYSTIIYSLEQEYPQDLSDVQWANTGSYNKSDSYPPPQSIRMPDTPKAAQSTTSSKKEYVVGSYTREDIMATRWLRELYGHLIGLSNENTIPPPTEEPRLKYDPKSTGVGSKPPKEWPLSPKKNKDEPREKSPPGQLRGDESKHIQKIQYETNLLEKASNLILKTDALMGRGDKKDEQINRARERIQKIIDDISRLDDENQKQAKKISLEDRIDRYLHHLSKNNASFIEKKLDDSFAKLNLGTSMTHILTNIDNLEYGSNLKDLRKKDKRSLLLILKHKRLHKILILLLYHHFQRKGRRLTKKQIEKRLRYLYLLLSSTQTFQM